MSFSWLPFWIFLYSFWRCFFGPLIGLVIRPLPNRSRSAQKWYLHFLLVGISRRFFFLIIAHQRGGRNDPETWMKNTVLLSNFMPNNILLYNPWVIWTQLLNHDFSWMSSEPNPRQAQALSVESNNYHQSMWDSRKSSQPEIAFKYFNSMLLLWFLSWSTNSICFRDVQKIVSVFNV